jgi:hypothetical protein
MSHIDDSIESAEEELEDRGDDSVDICVPDEIIEGCKFPSDERDGGIDDCSIEYYREDAEEECDGY